LVLLFVPGSVNTVLNVLMSLMKRTELTLLFIL